MSKLTKDEIMAALAELEPGERQSTLKEVAVFDSSQAKKSLEKNIMAYNKLMVEQVNPLLEQIRKVDPAFETPAADNVGNLINKALDKAGEEGLTVAELVAALDKPKAKISSVLNKYKEDGWKKDKAGNASGKARYTQNAKTEKWIRISTSSV